MKEPKKMGLLERKQYDRSVRRRKERIKYATIGSVVVILLVLVFVSWKPWKYFGGGEAIRTGKETSGNKEAGKGDSQSSETKIAEAKRLQMSYAYDEAVALLKTIDGYDKDAKIKKMISDIEAEKAACVPVKLEEVTHIFYHSLVVDEERCFGNPNDPQSAGNNQWMTTIDEFNAITQEMYDRGFVIVSIHDLYDVTTDANGKEVWEPAEILLPKGKQAVVVSMDDLSYYHSYDNYGYAARLILDDEGNVVNEYYDANGELHIGAYDYVPLLDQFIEEHPDASYKGAKGIIAMTGYNGVLGYRTDKTYDLSDPDCDRHQKAWIAAHPDFTLENERAEAKKVADAMKANGWEFASHSWGHIRMGDKSLGTIQVDTKKWKENVEPIIGETNTLIFAHGQDFYAYFGEYPESDAKYQYLREQGFRIFCTVDSTRYQTHLGTDYMRQGRRNLDGYRIYKNAIGEQNNVSDLFDAATILDPDRPPVPEL